MTWGEFHHLLEQESVAGMQGRRIRDEAGEADDEARAVCHQQAKRVSDWVQATPDLAIRGLIVGSVPVGQGPPGIRIAKLGDVNRTTVYWTDVPLRLAEIEPAIEWIIERLGRDGAATVSGTQRAVPLDQLGAWNHVLRVMGSPVGAYAGTMAGLMPARLLREGYAYLEEFLTGMYPGIQIMRPRMLVEDKPLNLERLTAAIEAADKVFGE